MLGPFALEINRVSQNQPRQRVKSTGLYKLFNFVFSFVFDPGIDCFSGLFGLCLEIDLFEIAVVICFDQRQVIGEKFEVLLPPERVGDDKLKGAFLARGVELFYYFAECFVKLLTRFARESRRVDRKIKRLCHLFGGLTFGSGISHCQGG